MFHNHFPRLVVTGRDQSLQLANLCAKNGWTKPFLISDEGVRSAGIFDHVWAPLSRSGSHVDSYCTEIGEPSFQTVETIVAKLKQSGADVVIGLGGGSVMDAVKVAAICSRHEKPVESFVGIGRVEKRGLPTILIPTTAGTGSEATFVAILSDPQSKNKVGIVDPAIMTDLAIVDPSLTDTLRAHVTAATGMDALVHAIEAFIARVATPVARGLALEAVRHIGPSLQRAVEFPDDREARDGMAIGSHLAGMAFANSSCCAVHALALPLGGRYPIPHGVITGCFVGEVMRHNATCCEKDFSTLCSSLGWNLPSIDHFANQLDAIADAIGLRDALNKFTIPEASMFAMASDAIKNRRLMDPNPREVSIDDAVRIYQSVLSAAS